MGTKMAVAFSVIFMADREKRLLMARPYKPLVWKRFDDIFSLWDISTKEVYNFVDFANTCHPTKLISSLRVKYHLNALFFLILRF